jgi:hypothetical protein
VSTSSPSLHGPVAGGPIESKIALDMVRRGAPFVPVLLMLSAFVWGKNGAISAAVAIALVFFNFLLAAAMLGWAAKISAAAVMGAALFGYLLRLIIIGAVVLPLRDAAWFRVWPLGITLVVTHLGLLMWELRHVSISFSEPGVKPRQSGGKFSRKSSVKNTVTNTRSES